MKINLQLVICIPLTTYSLIVAGIHINKALYSFSYTCVTTGAAGILLATIYLVVSFINSRALPVFIQLTCGRTLQILNRGYFLVGGRVRMQEVYYGAPMDGNERVSDICSRSLQYSTTYSTRILLEPS